jgi:uncharacterized protein YoxC|tara:strand:+ start:1224 stop:1550 length:327 start_codon:yes stop_codon:yes gene_type:complete
MDIAQAVELYGQLGATGVISCIFVFLIMNLIRSQRDQTDDLDKIKQSISKMETEINSTYSISIKLIDSINSFKNNMNDKLDRRHEAVMKEIDDMSDKISYMSGRINGK